jgi:ammonia channel protein AmtB
LRFGAQELVGARERGGAPKGFPVYVFPRCTRQSIRQGNAVQVIYQIGGVAIVLIYDGVVSLIILKLIDWTLGLRVTEDEETIGLDLTLHGEAVQ